MWVGEREKPNCFDCQYFRINPPIVEEPYRCTQGAKQMPSFWEREHKTADDCPFITRGGVKHEAN